MDKATINILTTQKKKFPPQEQDLAATKPVLSHFIFSVLRIVCKKDYIVQ